MSEQTLIMYTSPTLAGMKTGSLFAQKFTDKNIMLQEIREYNRKFEKKGLCLIPVGWQENRVLLYLFRPSSLAKDLSESSRRRILQDAGYECTNTSQCIRKLIERIGEGESFPHEIGVFLGYPPEDVEGFIKNGAANCKCIGLWKVYGDVTKAQKMFALYKQCTRCYCRQWSQGVPLEKLLVAV